MNAMMNNPLKKKRRPLDGVLLFDKPQGLSSNGVLQQVKRLYNAEKAGHAGTLDPMATGMLPICFGEATKFTTQLLDNAKTYAFTCELGTKTDSGDKAGSIIENAAIPELSQTLLTTVLQQFMGEIAQIPPMVSALHHEGKRLYELARAGIEVPRPARTLTIYALNLTAFTKTSFSAEVNCSKGTYVRVLAEDIACTLGTVGHLTQLRRTTIEPFNDRPLISLEQLYACASDLTQLDNYLLPPDSALMDLPTLSFCAEETARLFLGQRIPVGEVLTAPLYRLYGPSAAFVGIGYPHTPYVIGPKRIIRRPVHSPKDQG